VVGGEPVARRVGGNRHHYLARRLAEEFERQWPDTAVAPGHWVLQMTEGRVQLGRVPDVLVDRETMLTAPVFVGVPNLVLRRPG
jgi:hypothetical protein